MDYEKDKLVLCLLVGFFDVSMDGAHRAADFVGDRPHGHPLGAKLDDPLASLLRLGEELTSFLGDNAPDRSR